MQKGNCLHLENVRFQFASRHERRKDRLALIDKTDSLTFTLLKSDYRILKIACQVHKVEIKTGLGWS